MLPGHLLENLSRRVDRLARASVLYLSLPYLLFASGWLRLQYSVVFSLVLLAGVALFWRSTSRPAEQTDKPASLSFVSHLLVAAIVLVWVSLSGVGGHGSQNYDYLKHNAVFKDLVQFEWPVCYGAFRQDGVSYYQVYYTAFYLPAALVGKVFGWNAANHSLFLWAFAGAYLSVRWFMVLSGRLAVLPALLFVAFGGLDFLGHFVLSGDFFTGTQHVEHWCRETTKDSSQVMQYTSNTALLFWVPQHCVPGWLLAGLILHEGAFRKECANAFFLCSLGALWSPLAAIGLTPYCALAVFRNRWRNAFSLQNLLVPPVVVAVVGAYYLSRTAEIPHGWIWEFYDLRVLWPRILLFLALEFGLYAVFCRSQSNAATPGRKVWFLTAVCCLTFLPLYRLGVHNDWAMRVSIPSLFVFWLFVSDSLSVAGTQDGLRRRVLACTIFLGAWSGGTEIARSCNRLSIRPPDYTQTKGMMDLELYRSDQYIGSRDSFFFRTLGPPGAAGED